MNKKPASWAALAMALLAGAAQAADPRLARHGEPMDDGALEDVHAAGLPDATLQTLVQGSAAGTAAVDALLQRLQEQGSALDRQQALAQLRMAAGVTQVSVTALGTSALAGMTVAIAPVAMPVAAMPLPFFFMPSLPQQDPPKH